MDEETYDQFSLPHAELAAELPYMQPNTSVQILEVNGKPSGVQLPASVELAVVETEPGVKGDTVNNVTKAATPKIAQLSKCRCSSTSATCSTRKSPSISRA